MEVFRIILKEENNKVSYDSFEKELNKVLTQFSVPYNINLSCIKITTTLHTTCFRHVIYSVIYIKWNNRPCTMKLKDE